MAKSFWHQYDFAIKCKIKIVIIFIFCCIRSAAMNNKDSININGTWLWILTGGVVIITTRMYSVPVATTRSKKEEDENGKCVYEPSEREKEREKSGNQRAR